MWRGSLFGVREVFIKKHSRRRLDLRCLQRTHTYGDERGGVPCGAPRCGRLVARVPDLRPAPLGDDRRACARREADPEVSETGGFSRCCEELWCGVLPRAACAQVESGWVPSGECRDCRHVLEVLREAGCSPPRRVYCEVP